MDTPTAKWPSMSPELQGFIEAADRVLHMNMPLVPTSWELQYTKAREALMNSIKPVEFDPTPLIPTDR